MRVRTPHLPQVLNTACCALYTLLSRSPPARLLFLRKRGVGELAECLHDYNLTLPRSHNLA